MSVAKVSGSTPIPTQWAWTCPAASARVRLVGERPGVVVDRSAVGLVVFGFPAQLLGEFANDAAPQGEVVFGVPRLVAGRLEDADRQDLIHALGVADGGAVAAVQRKRHRACRSVVSQGQRAQGNVHRATCWVAGVADCGPEILRGDLAEFVCGELVRDGIADVGAIEVGTATEHHMRARVQVCAQEAIRAAVLEDAGRGERGDGVGVGAVPRAVGPYRQQPLDDGLGARDAVECRVGRVPQLDVVERNRCVRQPARCAEQGCSFDRCGFRVVAGRADGEFVSVFAEAIPDS